MGLFYEGFTFGNIVALILFIALWVVLNEVTRRSKKISIFAYCVLPVLLAALVFVDVLGSPTGKTWFAWVKVVSALAGVLGFMVIRFTNAGKTKFAAYYPLAILSLNIAEAVYREFEIYFTVDVMGRDAGGVMVLGGTWNILNAIAGIICIITLTGFIGIRASNDDSKDMIWADMTWPYIVGYTLWNYAYVYNCISTRALYAGFSILTAALIGEYVFKRGAWLQHRAQTLALYVMFSLSIDFQASPYFQVEPTYKPSMWMTISVISFVFNVGLLAYMIYTAKKYKRNPYKEELYTHTNSYKKTIEANNL
ncbi:MAG: hypothetical protein GX366_08725 [Epulopiscium sp.]|nr:hypothetical protein [Candidatus Epulonipiscium sp.]